MNRNESVDFYEDEFRNQNKDVRWLCQIIKNEGYALGRMNTPEDTIERLNELLQLPGLFEMIVEKKSLYLTDQIKSLRDETAENRKELFENLSDSEQKAIKRLNRLIIELAYPRETPKNSYELRALIRTKQGNTFLQDYQNIEAFKREMKEHRSDVEWGLLVRCDEGRIVDDYFSELGDRGKIGLVKTDSKSADVTPEGLNPQQAALRETVIEHFKSNKAKAFISEQLTYINVNRQLGETISFFLDSNRKLPALAPLEDIIAEREKIEATIKWLEAMCSELNKQLTNLKVIEDTGLELIGLDQGE